MRYDWKFHCYPDNIYWECTIYPDHDESRTIRSADSFKTRADAIRNAKKHELATDDDTHVIVFRRYGA
jgi:hypothetical protein